MQSVTSLIEASNHRFEILHKKDALRADLRKQYGRMQVSYDQIRICGSDEVFSCASQLMEVHLNNENEITRFQGWMTEFPALKTKTVGNLADLNDIKPEQLYAYHHTLISEVQIQLKLVSRKDAQIFTWKDESKKDQEI